METGQLAIYMNYTLAWIGLGMVFGLLALIVMPSPDSRGSLATVLMATSGTMVGCLMLQYLTYQRDFVQPMTVQGFTVGMGGAVVMLIFFRVLGTYWLLDGDYGFFRHHRRRRRRYLSSEIEQAANRRRTIE